MDVESSTTSKITSTRTTNKRSNKPLMERRRRARINNCLAQLKSLLVQDADKDNSHISKLEKAEILELTVRKLKKLQELINSENNIAYREHPRYRDGFNDCIGEVGDYFLKKDCINTEFRSRVINHLNNCYSNTCQTMKREVAPNGLNCPNTNTKKTEPISPSVDFKSLNGLAYNSSKISSTTDGRDRHPASLGVVNSQPSQPVQIQAISIDPHMIAGHHPVQFHTNSHPQRSQNFCEVSTKHVNQNDSQIMDIPSNEPKAIVRNVPTTLDIGDVFRNGNQVPVTDNNNGMPIAFLVTTPLAIKAIPLYTSVDQPQRLATLSPTGTIVATPSSSPVGSLSQTPQEGTVDSFEMKADGNMSDSAYSTADEGATSNTSIQNVWRPWRMEEH